MRILTLLFLSLAVTLSGCSWMGFDDEDEDVNIVEAETAGFNESQFNEAIEANLNSGNWQKAIQNLQTLEARFPFGQYAETAQMNIIYAYYRSGDYQAAIASADRFTRLHPQHRNADYVLYMKGLATYSESNSFVGGFMPTDATKRDPGPARESFAAFNQLLVRYPDSTYAADARKRMINLRNHLARYEINVANYYFKRGAYLAALNRGQYVIKNYQLTPSVPDGLAVSAQAYYLLGLQDLANDNAQVLVINYPNHPALNKDGTFIYDVDITGEKRSWLNQITFGLSGNANAPGYDTRNIYNPIYQPKSGQGSNTAEEKSWLNILSLGLFN
jgi:outer membrane protein assembly factor BamD